MSWCTRYLCVTLHPIITAILILAVIDLMSDQTRPDQTHCQLLHIALHRTAPIDVFLLRFRGDCCCFALCGCGEDLRPRLRLVHLASVHHRQGKPGMVQDRIRYDRMIKEGIGLDDGGQNNVMVVDNLMIDSDRNGESTRWIR